MPEQNSLIFWNFPEFNLPERSRAWYFWAALIGVILLLIAITMGNFLFGLIIILVAIILFIRHNQKAEQVEFQITEQGIKVGDRFFEFFDFKHFWIVYEPPEIKNLYFEFKNTIRPRLTIALEDINPVKVRKILKNYLTEDLERDTEPTSEALGRRLQL